MLEVSLPYVWHVTWDFLAFLTNLIPANNEEFAGMQELNEVSRPD
jgi:hypothetical protein